MVLWDRASPNSLEVVRESGTLLMVEGLDLQFPLRMIAGVRWSLQGPLQTLLWGSPCPHQTIQSKTLALLQSVNFVPVPSTLLDLPLYLKPNLVVFHHPHHLLVFSNIPYFEAKELLLLLLHNFMPLVGPGVKEWTARQVETTSVLASGLVLENSQGSHASVFWLHSSGFL